MNLLSVKGLTQSYGNGPVYTDVSFGVDDSEKVAIVGSNGVGKTTLFRILVGQIEPDSGVIALRQGATLNYLSQEVGFDGALTPRQVVARAVERVQAVIAEHDTISAQIASCAPGDDFERLLQEQELLQLEIEKLGGWDWERRVDEMLDRLGLESVLDTPAERLSGGQQRRVDLARVLLETADLLMLDEPTNHLDPQTVDWLEGWLRNKTRGLLLVTHDRYFLERVVDRIVEVSPTAFYDFPGRYQVFMERKLARMRLDGRAQAREQRLIADELDRLKNSAKPLTTIESKRYSTLSMSKDTPRAGETDDDLMKMQLATGKELGPLVLSGRGLVKRLGDKLLFDGADFNIASGEKVGLVGPNGAGKTTLLRMLMGELRPDAGTVEMGEHTEVAYLRQQGPPVDPDLTVYESLGPSDYVWVGDTRHHKRRFLEQFLFDQRTQKTALRLLSGGQKRRLQLARVVAQNANTLVLDEPTNDLDILALQALETALEDFPGCVLVVSHDRYFLNRLCNVIMAVEDHKIVRYDGNYDRYKKALERKLQRDKDIAAQQRSEAKQQRRETRQQAREQVKFTSKHKRELETLEREIADAEEQRADLEEQLADPGLYDRADVAERLSAIRARTDEVDAKLERAYERWMELEALKG